MSKSPHHSELRLGSGELLICQHVTFGGKRWGLFLWMSMFASWILNKSSSVRVLFRTLAALKCSLEEVTSNHSN